MITLFEEYNDNVFLDNRARRADWVSGAAPGFTLDFRGDTYRLTAGYNFVAEMYSRLTRLGGVFNRQNGALDGMYRAGRQVTLTLTDTYINSLDTSLVAASGIATGRARSSANTVTPGATWELDPLWTLRLAGTYTAERFNRRDLVESDIYHLTPTVERKLSERLTGTAGYEVGYFSVERQPDVVTHAPRLGARYRFTPTLSGSVSAGPTIEVSDDGRDLVKPAVTASLRQEFQLGSASFGYDRSVGTAGGLGGTTENDVVTGLLRLSELWRGLSVELSPRYTHARSSLFRSSGSRIDAHTWSVGLRSVYKVTTWMSLYLGYTFYQQRSNTSLAADADQDRASFGVQFGYPLTLD